MTLSFAVPVRAAPWRLGTCALLALLLAVASTSAAGPVPGQSTAAPQAIAANDCPSFQTPLPSTNAGTTLVAGIIGDRQRMVQVALICMGIALLILTRGNRF